MIFTLQRSLQQNLHQDCIGQHMRSETNVSRQRNSEVVGNATCQGKTAVGGPGLLLASWSSCSYKALPNTVLTFSAPSSLGQVSRIKFSSVCTMYMFIDHSKIPNFYPRWKAEHLPWKTVVIEPFSVNRSGAWLAPSGWSKRAFGKKLAGSLSAVASHQSRVGQTVAKIGWNKI